MPTLRSGTTTTDADPTTKTTTDQTFCPVIDVLIPTVDRESAGEPAGKGKDWVIACVVFNAQEFGKDQTQLFKWTWWLRFRADDHMTYDELALRAKEITRLQYSPPMSSHQRQCDFCSYYSAENKKTYHYYIPDDNFISVAIMPFDMHTSDDDYDAEIGPEMTIAACTRMKAARDARQKQADRNAFKIQQFEKQQYAELVKFKNQLNHE
jgi:hypothetical protein